ncbi:hypothetical protein TSOC_009545 [Tetrabaena socialis]|uniref:Uncharacterized protein n=1 Tax=Tetrabaena socialis TaxID=47790 RepID=A0A2J7ZVL5_9CHLO|nr:hypothetical protein TSOC_009545 [Tetrabaena socialis]|eukprot:PNH04312.1 hypothetical protein TSOC_009545 [Tetrabaena socialis]
MDPPRLLAARAKVATAKGHVTKVWTTWLNDSDKSSAMESSLSIASVAHVHAVQLLSDAIKELRAAELEAEASVLPGGSEALPGRASTAELPAVAPVRVQVRQPEREAQCSRPPLPSPPATTTNGGSILDRQPATAPVTVPQQEGRGSGGSIETAVTMLTDQQPQEQQERERKTASPSSSGNDLPDIRTSSSVASSTAAQRRSSASTPPQEQQDAASDVVCEQDILLGTALLKDGRSSCAAHEVRRRAPWLGMFRT